MVSRARRRLTAEERRAKILSAAVQAFATTVMTVRRWTASRLFRRSFCAHLLFCSKNIERIGDRATHIAETVVYLVTGNSMPTQRPHGARSTTWISIPALPGATYEPGAQGDCSPQGRLRAPHSRR
jgi:hypothetical protein